MHIPSVEEVDRVSKIPDPVIRNLNITHCYYEISSAMKEIIGENPNWCTYAVWASKQAGQSIRQEDLIRSLEYRLRNSHDILLLLQNISLSDILKNIPDLNSFINSIINLLDAKRIFESSSNSIANGNRKVFEEIGKEFARFLHHFNENNFTEESLKSFIDKLKPGDSPDGQDLLKDAFTSYFKARSENDPKFKAELFHYANLLIGFHEQTRLQPEIVEAMDAPLSNLDDLRYKIFKQFFPGIWLHIRYFLSKIFRIKFPLDEFLNRLIEDLKREVRKVITDCMMSLFIPGYEDLRLGKDLSIPFPQVLMHFSNESLLKLLTKIDPTPDDLKESGAEDWGNFNDRIHFIADFFRCFHNYHLLFDPPFTDEQVLALKEKRIPEGRL
jgi:hypothetical protein